MTKKRKSSSSRRNDFLDLVCEALQKDPQLLDLAAATLQVFRTYAFYSPEGRSNDLKINKSLAEKKDLLMQVFQQNHNIHFETKDQLMEVLKKTIDLEDPPEEPRTLKF